VGSLDASNIMMESVTGIFAVVGNALVIWAVKLSPAPQKITLFSIISLALTGVAVGILGVPRAGTVSLGVTIRFYCRVFTCCLALVFSHASMLSLLAIADHRHLRVKLPTRSFFWRIASNVILGLCWLVSVLVGLLPMLGWSQHTGRSSCIECRCLAAMRLDGVVYFSFFAWLLLPLLVTCALYTEISYIMCIKLSPSSANPPGGRVCGKEYKMAKYLALILFLFAVSWLPLGILTCVSYLCPSCAIPEPLMYLGTLLSRANSAMNAVVHAFKIQKFKDTYTFILSTYILLQK
ncbi:AA3R protein, partial [Steatornis caripensis]|nr:AA3R protein [Steatornis caripensis]